MFVQCPYPPPGAFMHWRYISSRYAARHGGGPNGVFVPIELGDLPIRTGDMDWLGECSFVVPVLNTWPLRPKGEQYNPQ